MIFYRSVFSATESTGLFFFDGSSCFKRKRKSINLSSYRIGGLIRFIHDMAEIVYIIKSIMMSYV